MQLEGWRQHREDMANRTPAPRRYVIFAVLWTLLFIAWTVMAIQHHSLSEVALGAVYLIGVIWALWRAQRDLRLLRERDDGA